MADSIFENSELVAVYDYFDGQRDDLILYIQLAKNLNATHVIDVGCGTGCLSTLLVENGFEVTAVDPARASLEAASKKPFADKVHWINGDATDLPDAVGDLAVMTGNVAQVFLEDADFHNTLRQIRRALKPEGVIAFEVRNPAKQAWFGWNRDHTCTSLEIPSIGEVISWCQLDHVEDEFVTFTWTYEFVSSKKAITSKSTLRFRNEQQIMTALRASGFD